MNSLTLFYSFSGIFMFFMEVVARSNCSYSRCDFKLNICSMTAMVPKMLAFMSAPEMRRAQLRIV